MKLNKLALIESLKERKSALELAKEDFIAKKAKWDEEVDLWAQEQLLVGNYTVTQNYNGCPEVKFLDKFSGDKLPHSRDFDGEIRSITSELAILALADGDSVNVTLDKRKAINKLLGL